MNGRHVIQDAVILAERPVQPAGGADYNLLDSVAADGPAPGEPTWQPIAEVSLDGQSVRWSP